MEKKISAVYKITNTITGDFYIGSSKDVKKRWASHKWPSSWNEQQNNPMYLDMQKYGLESFVFEVIAEAEPEQLKKKEQEFIEALKPTYNNRNANGLDVEKVKECQKRYNQSEKGKKHIREYNKKYHRSEKSKESQKKYQKKYYSQLCSYNGKTLTLKALVLRFYRAGIENPTQEAKKYLLTKNKVSIMIK